MGDFDWTREQTSERDDPHRDLVVTGYLMAVVIPIVGFVIGIVVATRQTRAARHGSRIIILSVLAFAIYMALIVHAIQQQNAYQPQDQYSSSCDSNYQVCSSDYN